MNQRLFLTLKYDIAALPALCAKLAGKTNPFMGSAAEI